MVPTQDHLDLLVTEGAQLLHGKDAVEALCRKSKELLLGRTATARKKLNYDTIFAAESSEVRPVKFKHSVRSKVKLGQSPAPTLILTELI